MFCSMKYYINSIINNNLRYSSNCERRDDDRITTRIPDIGNPDIGNPDIGNPDIGNPDIGKPDNVGIPYVGIPCVLYRIPTIGSACGIITVLASTTVDLYFLHYFHLDSSEVV